MTAQVSVERRHKDLGDSHKHTAALTLSALGVVFGDIGTSPLYTLRECFGHALGLAPNEANVLGILSLLFWALVLVVTLKYVVLMMRADNHGEGGTLALTALALESAHQKFDIKKGAPFLLLLGLFGASLFYGDALITPAISVTSAMEGLQLLTPAFTPYVVPLTLLIVLGLFAIQHKGTASMGFLFGPVMLVWFVVLGVLGAIQIYAYPSVLRALSPFYAADFVALHGAWTFFVLGAVVLAVTGGEALYADMGHFGKAPIRLAWFKVAFPALVLNYFGQGALMLTAPATVENPFFLMAPDGFLLPLLVLATFATVIASQAVISGAYSLTRQAIQLGYLPRLDIKHTSAKEAGQIYVPPINWVMLAFVVALVLLFRSSSNMAAAYGIAVTGVMLISTIQIFVVFRHRLSRLAFVLFVPFFLLFFCVDVLFLGANMLKFFRGGWVPVLFGFCVFSCMYIWIRGRAVVYKRLYTHALPLEKFVGDLPKVARAPHTAVFMTNDLATVPQALMHNVKHNAVLHQQVVLVRVVTEAQPRVACAHRVAFSDCGKGVYTVLLRYGFMEQPHVPRALEICRHNGWLALDMGSISYFLSRQTLVPSAKKDMPAWQEYIFLALDAVALNATIFFRIPPEQVVEVGSRLEI